MSDDNQHDRLLDAVDALTKDRNVVQWQDTHDHEWTACDGKHDAYGIERCTDLDCKQDICEQCGARRSTNPDTENPEGRLGVHTEIHPPLLTMLIDGVSSQGASASSDPGIPIDADALELWGMVRDLVKAWCKQLGVTFLGDDLLLSINRWYLAHANAHRAQRVSDVIDHDVTRMVEGWVRMIENKFDPPPRAELKDPCPAYLPIATEGEPLRFRRCGARRVEVDGTEQFAIQLNWKTLHAECSRCRTTWDGERGFMTLRYESNLYTEERRLVEEERQAALDALANPIRDTPGEMVEGITA